VKVLTKMELTEIDEIFIGECIKKIASVLNSRRRLVKVRGVKETSFTQAIALGAMFYRLRDLYPPEAMEIIEREAKRIAPMIGAPPKKRTT